MRWLLILLLAGCSRHPVMPYGPDTYIVNSSGSTIVSTRGKAETSALRSANAHCSKIGKVMQVADLQSSGNAWTGTSGRLVFKCV